jgi:hypothetical protein
MLVPAAGMGARRQEPPRMNPTPAPARRRIFAVSFAAVLLTATVAAARPEERTARRPVTARTPVEAAVVTVQLHPPQLAVLGLSLRNVEASATGHRTHRLLVVRPGASSFTARPSGLSLDLTGDAFAGFSGGSLRLDGGFRLVAPQAASPLVFDFAGATLVPGDDPHTLHLTAKDGTPLLAAVQAQWEQDAAAGTLSFINADLRVLPAMAERLGDLRLAGTPIGVLAVDLRSRPVPGAAAESARLAAAEAGSPPPACGDWSGEVDVALIDIYAVNQAGGQPQQSASVVVVPSVTLKNVGTANVPWYTKYTSAQPGVGFSPSWSPPPYYNDQHPFLVWQLLREHDGIFATLGRSSLKHAFATGNYNCDPGACGFGGSPMNILGLGCEDPYNFGSNTFPTALGPRDEVTASTGIWAHCNDPDTNGALVETHFDGDGANPVDCVQDHPSGGHNYFTHGLTVAGSTLGVAGARYYLEAFYVVRDDVNILNTMGHVEVTPTWTGSLWTFPRVGAFTSGPAISRWAQPPVAGIATENRLLDTGGAGHVQLAARVTPLGPSYSRYSYALQNHDFDRRIRSFRVPFDTSAGVFVTLFADGDSHAANDWAVAVDGAGVTWTAPAGAMPAGVAAPQDWASVYTFVIDSVAASASALAVLEPFEAGGPSSYAMRTLAPAAGQPPGHFHTLTPCRLFDSREPASGAAPLAHGHSRSVPTVGAGGCGVPAAATAVALNVTVVDATAGGQVSVHPDDLPVAPTTATTMFPAAVTRATSVVAQLSPQGALAVLPTLSPGATVHVVLDVVGYFGP